MYISQLSLEDFESKLNEFKMAVNDPSHKYVIDKDLEVIDKSGWKWKVLCLMQPFYRLFGIDIYSHVRLDQVASSLSKLCNLNSGHLYNKPELKISLTDHIVKPLTGRLGKSKNHLIYKSSLDIILARWFTYKSSL